VSATKPTANPTNSCGPAAGTRAPTLGAGDAEGVDTELGVGDGEEDGVFVPPLGDVDGDGDGDTATGFASPDATER
jgi:hypothetical protein